MPPVPASYMGILHLVLVQVYPVSLPPLVSWHTPSLPGFCHLPLPGPFLVPGYLLPLPSEPPGRPRHAGPASRTRRQPLFLFFSSRPLHHVLYSPPWPRH